MPQITSKRSSSERWFISQGSWGQEQERGVAGQVPAPGQQGHPRPSAAGWLACAAQPPSHGWRLAGASGMTDGPAHSLFLQLPSRVPDGLQRQLCSRGECFKRTSPSTCGRQPYRWLMSHWSERVTQPSPKSGWEGTTQVCGHQGA